MTAEDAARVSRELSEALEKCSRMYVRLKEGEVLCDGIDLVKLRDGLRRSEEDLKDAAARWRAAFSRRSDARDP